MRVENPPNRTEVENLERDEQIEHDKRESASPHVLESMSSVHVAGPGDPADRVGQAHDYVHFHVIAIVELDRTEIVAVIDEIG